MTKNQHYIDDYNNKYIQLILEKSANFFREICPDEVFYNMNTDKNNTDFWKRLEIQDGICSTNYYNYKVIFDFCIKQGIKRVFDVGGNWGFANFIIKEEKLPLEYIVVENIAEKQTFAPIIRKNYPTKIYSTNTDALISHLCLGLMYTPRSSLPMFNRAIRDFDHVILEVDARYIKPMTDNFPTQIVQRSKDFPILYFDTSSHKQLTQQKELQMSK